MYVHKKLKVSTSMILYSKFRCAWTFEKCYLLSAARAPAKSKRKRGQDTWMLRMLEGRRGKRGKEKRESFGESNGCMYACWENSIRMSERAQEKGGEKEEDEDENEGAGEEEGERKREEQAQEQEQQEEGKGIGGGLGRR